MSAKPESDEPQLPEQQLHSTAGDSVITFSNHVEVAEIHKLLIEIKNVLGSFLLELKPSIQRQLDSDVKESPPDRDEESNLAASSSPQARLKSESSQTRSTRKKGPIFYRKPYFLESVSTEDMAALRDCFLNQDVPGESSLLLSTNFYRKPSVKGSKRFQIEVCWRGVVITISRESETAMSGGVFSLFFRKERDVQSICVSDIITKEWASNPPLSSNLDRGITVWELGKRRGWTAIELVQLSVTDSGRLEQSMKQFWCNDPRPALEYKFKELQRTPIKIWRLYFDGGMISFSRISTIYAISSFPGLSSNFSMTNSLFWLFAGPWEERKLDSHYHTESLTIELALLYRLRMIEAQSQTDTEAKQRKENSGITLSRLKGYFPSYMKRSPGRFQERRISLAFYLRHQAFEPKLVPRGKVVVLTDVSIQKWPYPESDLDVDPEEDGGIEGWQWCHYVFQSQVKKSHEIWEKEWSKCLDKIDQCIRLKAEDVFDSEIIEDLMFDESFGRSKLYFTVLQMLRVFSDLIFEVGKDLRQVDVSYQHLTQCFSSRSRVVCHTTDDLVALMANWKYIMNLQEASEKRLLNRIRLKTAEIESLRDGLFNATSVREASRSTSMNRAVIVFTIVTVIYLPASFIATIFGTQLFNGEDTAGTINKFKITTIIVSITTFAVAILLVLLAANLHHLKRTSTYRKLTGKMQRSGRPVEKDEKSRLAGEENYESGEEKPKRLLHNLRKRFQWTPKEEESQIP